MMKKFLLHLILLTPLLGYSQLEFHRSNAIMVMENGELLSYPWAGGMNSSQWSPIDLNNDGTDDLFVFDRTARTFNTYLADPLTGLFHLTFEYHDAFPPVRDWVLLRDFNCDGKNDIFTYTPGAIRVYENTSQGSSVSFQLRAPVLESYYDFGADPYYSSIYMSNVDIPSIDDFDGDGDLDIHTFTLAGQTIEYHENLASDIGNCDSLAFVLENRCYGMVGEDAISPTVYIGQDYIDGEFCTFNVPDPEEGPKSMKDGAHSGSTLCAFDYDHNGQKDLLIGDITAEDMVMVYFEDRGVLPDSAIMTEVGFPSTDVPIDMIVFNAAFFIDVNMDNEKDLIVSPGNGTESEDLESTWYYLNTGTTDEPVFSRQSTDFFQDQMIDAGTGAFPRFTDVNADGRVDLILSNRGLYQDDGTYSERVILYLQTGPVEDPIFEWNTDDFQGIASLGFGGHIVPTFSDMDNDGDQDMILGDGDGELHYFENSAGPGLPMSFNTYSTIQADGGGNLDIGANLIPQLFDLDQDGLTDLLVGERNGHINYFRNEGTAEVFDLVLVEDSIGDILTDLDGNQVGYSAPWFFLNESDEISALIGTEHGNLFFIENVDPDPHSTWTITDSTAFNIMNGIRSCPVLTELNGDGLMDMVNGDISGGLGLYLGGQDPVGISERDLELTFAVYPNPANSDLWIRTENPIDDPIEIIIYDITGRTLLKITDSAFVKGSIYLNIDRLTAGTYLVELRTDHSRGVVKFNKG